LGTREAESEEEDVRLGEGRVRGGERENTSTIKTDRESERQRERTYINHQGR
jgi:hypothetical protein